MRSAQSQGSRRSIDRGRAVARQVEDVLRTRILSLELKPGVVLSRAGLVAEFGLSNTPVRDALLRLEEEGLVQIFPQHTTLVSRIDLDMARQVHFLRRSTEIEAVRMLCRMEDATAAIDSLDIALRRMASRLHTSELDSFDELDRGFHHTILTAAGVPDLTAIIRRNSGHIDRLRRLTLLDGGKAERIICDHDRILSALRARDEDAAAEAMRQHLSGTLQMIDSIRERYPDLVVN